MSRPVEDGLLLAFRFLGIVKVSGPILRMVAHTSSVSKKSISLTAEFPVCSFCSAS